ncbi:MAG: gliding motility-associated C-terminal domain-containing protein [Bacteroidota bacterium]|nr:gliding motility-associated C-terminal domain-containing protein [Bacteroidota bacterium]
MKKIFLTLLITVSLAGFAQQGKDGAPTINASTIVNSYTTLSADATSGTSTITVAAIAGLAGGAINALSAGDLIMIIQMQGAVTNVLSPSPPWMDLNTSGPYDNTYGDITSYNNAGNNEFAEINSISGTTLTLNCQLKNSYSASGKTQIVRVPRYTSLTISGTGTITCPQWMRENGYGGVISIEVHGNTNIALGGKIDASGLGFRGGSWLGKNTSAFGSDVIGTTTNSAQSINKGESVAGDTTLYGTWQAKYGKGAIANGGGGGCSNNAGGGGGSNAGTTAWTGTGNPDVSTADYITCWNREVAGFATTTSSGGGRGGYSYANTNNDPRVNGPNSNANWLGDSRRNVGGFGGRPLDYSTGKLFLGGGGGSGDGDNNYQGAGGNGGGIVYLLSYGTVSGAGQINSNGANGENTYVGGPRNNGTDNAFSLWGRDGAGGAGGGGAVVVNSTGAISGIAINAKGGVGGNQQMINNGASSRNAYGPGGGGGGGYIGVNAGATSTNDASGGWSGIVTYLGTANGTMIDGVFPANGATKGGVGEIATSITNFSITTTGATICSGTTAVLTASLTGTAPNPITINWYTSDVGGNPIATGTSYTTATLTGNTTYYVGTCPGTYREPVTVTVGAAPSVSVNSGTVCNGQSVILTGSGATSFSWDTGDNTASITVNPGSTTTYTVTGSNGPGCQGVAIATVTVNNLPTVTVNSNPVSGLVCPGQSITLTGGGASSYVWTGGISDGVAFTPASSGTYTVTGTDGNGCQNTATANVTVNNLPTVTASSNPVSGLVCPGQTITLSGGGASSYAWSGGISDGVAFTPASSGTYTVTGTDGNGCQNTATASITVNNLPTVTANSNPANGLLCAGQTITLTGGGASSYVWTGGISDGVAFTPASSGTYTVTGTDGNGCQNTATANITVNNLPTVTVNSNPVSGLVCTGQTITLTGGGASSYVWSGGISDGVAFTPASSGTYTVTGTDANGCENTATASITVNNLPNVTVNSPSTCSGVATNLTANGADTYLWNTSETTATISVSPASNSSYTVTGTDANGCVNTAVADVTVTSTPNVTVNSESICIGQSATLTGNGTTSFSWNTGDATSSITVNPTSTTSYTVTGSNGPGCDNTAVATVTVNNLPTVTSVSSPANGQVCAGQSITLTGGGASSYVWTGGINDGVAFTPASSGTYTVTGTDVNGCQNVATTSITVNSLPAVTVNSPSTCAGLATTLTAGGADTYLWNTTETTSTVSVSPIASTSYTVTGTDVNGCINTAVANVTVTSAPTVTVNSVSICAGQSATLTGNGTATYSWNTGDATASITVNPTSTTSYTVTGSNGPGCDNTAVATVTVNSLPAVTVNSPAVCPGTSANLTADGANSYLWNTTETTTTISVTPGSSTSYTVIGTDLNGCVNSAVSTVTVNSLPTVTFSSNPANGSICSGQQITLSGSGAATYSWSGGVNDGVAFSPASSTTYTVTGTDANGCQNTSIASVTVTGAPTVSFVQNSGSICVNDCILFTETVSPSTATLTWDFGDGATGTTSTPTHCYTSAGIYNIGLTASTAPGCSTVVTIPNSVMVMPAANAQISVNPATTISLGETISFVADTGLAQTAYTWGFADPTSGTSNSSTLYNPSHTYGNVGTYCVTLTAGVSPCTDNETICIEVIKEAFISIPNIFTPNNDGLNDLFSISSSGITDIEGSIYDRWGLMIFSWSGVASNWDGKSKNGVEVADGVYYYIIQATDYKKEVKTYSGYTQLLAK